MWMKTGIFGSESTSLFYTKLKKNSEFIYFTLCLFFKNPLEAQNYLNGFFFILRGMFIILAIFSLVELKVSSLVDITIFISPQGT